MRYFYALSLLLALGLGRPVHAQQPFLKYGVTVKVATLSNGRFQEFFTNDSLRRIGSVVYDTRLHRVAYLLPPDSLVGHAKAEITSRWMSPDPLAEKFMYESPYVFVSNNPVNKFDPDGRSGIAAINAKNHTVTISSRYVFYGSKATTEISRNSANEISRMYNAAKASVTIDGVKYAVKFKISYSTVSEKQAVESAKGNTSAENNFVRVEDTNIKNRSFMEVGGNAGHFLPSDRLGQSTTAAHEAGHGYGLDHPASDDSRGQGQPGIMEPRGQRVDSQYQYDPSATPRENDGSSPGEPGSTLNPAKREVLPGEVQQMFKGVRFENGRANIGQPTNTIYNADGTVR